MTAVEELSFVPAGADSYELRRGDEALAGCGPPGAESAAAWIGEARLALAVEGDRHAVAATWRAFARDEHGDALATYFHGSVRGGRLRIGERTASLRRELGLGTEWRLRLRPDAAMALRPVGPPEALALELAYVPGSAQIPVAGVLLACWVVLGEEAVGPPRLAA